MWVSRIDMQCEFQCRMYEISMNWFEYKWRNTTQQIHSHIHTHTHSDNSCCRYYKKSFKLWLWRGEKIRMVQLQNKWAERATTTIGDSKRIYTIRRFDICSHTHTYKDYEIGLSPNAGMLWIRLRSPCHKFTHQKWMECFIICINFYLKKAGNQNRWRKLTCENQMEFYQISFLFMCRKSIILFGSIFLRVVWKKLWKFLCEKSSREVSYFGTLSNNINILWYDSLGDNNVIVIKV